MQNCLDLHEFLASVCVLNNRMNNGVARLMCLCNLIQGIHAIGKQMTETCSDKGVLDGREHNGNFGFLMYILT